MKRIRFEKHNGLLVSNANVQTNAGLLSVVLNESTRTVELVNVDTQEKVATISSKNRTHLLRLMKIRLIELGAQGLERETRKTSV